MASMAPQFSTGMFVPPGAAGVRADPRGIYMPGYSDARELYATQIDQPQGGPPQQNWTKNPWVWAGLVAGFGVLGLGAYLLPGS